MSGHFSFHWKGGAAERDEGEESANEQTRPNLRALTLNILAHCLAKGRSDADDSLATDVPCLPLLEQEGVGGAAYFPNVNIADKPSFTFRCPASSLQWERRWPVLRDLIFAEDPDLIGLQEVDLMPVNGAMGQRLTEHSSQIQRDLWAAGYAGAFGKKGGRTCDGVALFWRKTLLRSVGPSEIWPLGSGCHVALAQRLSIDGASEFTAVATHLKAGLSVDAENVRSQQAGALLRCLSKHTNVIVLADLNAHCRPFHSGRARSDSTASVTDSSPGLLVEPKAYPLLIKELRSAYQHVTGDEPAFTSWGGWLECDVRGVFDYILARGPLLTPRRVLCGPTTKEVLIFPERLPNPLHPTDHLPLSADFTVSSSGKASVARRPSITAEHPAKRSKIEAAELSKHSGWAAQWQ